MRLRISAALAQSRSYCRVSPPVVLGIETSCDDTGAAVVDSGGSVLGQDLCSQQSYSTRFGGVIPTFARMRHELKIESVVKNALERSNLTFKEIDAIAVTTRPGLPVCLRVGVNHAVKLCRSNGKPLITVHHMAAHAITVRLTDRRVTYPFLALLLSGGHSILAFVRSVADFLLLGNSIDTAPGEAFDKVARRLQLSHTKPEYEFLSGGQLIQTTALGGDHLAYALPYPIRRRDCNFSFSGLTTAALVHIEKHESLIGASISEDEVALRNMCASFQHAIFRHVAKKLLRAMAYVDKENLFTPGSSRYLVLSGGVACNSYIRNGLRYICENNNYELVAPPEKLCTDNGVMVAWLGVEQFLADYEILHNCPEYVQVEARASLGVDISDRIAEMNISAPRLKLSMNFHSYPFEDKKMDS